MIMLALAAAAIAQAPSQEIPVDDAIRIKEFYLVAAQIQDSRLNPRWKDAYFKHMLSMDSFFGN